MYIGFTHLHKMFFYIVFAILAVSTVKFILGWLGKKEFMPIDKKLATFTVIAVHIQVLIGLGLYFISPYKRSICFFYSYKMIKIFNSKKESNKFKKNEKIFLLTYLISFISWLCRNLSLTWSRFISCQRRKYSSILFIISCKLRD